MQCMHVPVTYKFVSQIVQAPWWHMAYQAALRWIEEVKAPKVIGLPEAMAQPRQCEQWAIC